MGLGFRTPLLPHSAQSDCSTVPSGYSLPTQGAVKHSCIFTLSGTLLHDTVAFHRLFNAHANNRPKKPEAKSSQRSSSNPEIHEARIPGILYPTLRPHSSSDLSRFSKHDSWRFTSTFWVLVKEFNRSYHNRIYSKHYGFLTMVA